MEKNKLPIKTIVVGIIVLVFLVLFKKEIGLVIMRMTSLEISHGDQGTVVKLNSPIGETVVSNTSGQGEPGSGYSEDRYSSDYEESMVHSGNGYKINWPKNGKWSRNKEMEGSFGMDLLVSYHKNIGDFNPNINVVVDRNAGSMTIDQYLDATQKTLVNMGWEIVDTKFDLATQSGVEIILNKNMFGGLYQIQKIILKNGVAYVATASKIQSSTQGYDELYAEMNTILNSFRV